MTPTRRSSRSDLRSDKGCATLSRVCTQGRGSGSAGRGVAVGRRNRRVGLSPIIRRQFAFPLDENNNVVIAM